MKLVLLTARGPEHYWVAHVLAQAFPVELAAIVVAEPTPRSLLQRAKRYAKRYSPGQLASRALAKLVDRVLSISASRQRTVAAELQTPDGAGLPRPDLLRIVPGFNSPACHALLDDIAPDIIAVYGTGMIGKGVMARAKKVILNLHSGVSPRYRGADSVFWALHNGEPQWVGATVHVLDSAVDAGPIYRTVTVNVAPGDDEGMLFARVVKAGAVAYADVIRQISRDEASPVVQNLGEGHEYRFVDRTVWAEWRVHRRVASAARREN